jgi:methionyl aminopeptidase
LCRNKDPELIEKTKQTCLEKYGCFSSAENKEVKKTQEKTMIENGAIPAEKGFPSGMKGVPDFPGSICASINDNIIHGIPSKYDILKEGDIISIDLVAYKDGFNGDCTRTYAVDTTQEIEEYGHFANKLWNASRFVSQHVYEKK